MKLEVWQYCNLDSSTLKSYTWCNILSKTCAWNWNRAHWLSYALTPCVIYKLFYYGRTILQYKVEVDDKSACPYLSLDLPLTPHTKHITSPWSLLSHDSRLCKQITVRQAERVMFNTYCTADFVRYLCFSQRQRIRINLTHQTIKLTNVLNNRTTLSSMMILLYMIIKITCSISTLLK